MMNDHASVVLNILNNKKLSSNFNSFLLFFFNMISG
jgi:hypothetical protein